MKITKDSLFVVTLLEDDPRTGYKKGNVFYPKGVYWNHGNLIVVGAKEHTIRVALPAGIVQVEVD